MAAKPNITAGALADIIRKRNLSAVVFADGSNQGADFTFDPPRHFDKNLFNVSVESEREWALHVVIFGKGGLEVGYSFSLCNFSNRLVFPAEPSDGCCKVNDAKVVNGVLFLYPE